MMPIEIQPELLALFEKMLLLRCFEERVQEIYKAGKMPGFVHLYIGQEAVAVGVCAHLEKFDWITSTHRGHGHALAKGVSPEKVMAELYGKATGCNGGRGGSMHLYDADVGLLGTNGFVGGGLPSAVGAGLGARLQKTGGVAVAFFGEGTTSHGSFHESINLAGALDTPVVFVCENNLYATATPLKNATKNPDIASRAAAYGIPGQSVDGNDVLAVWQAAKTAIERARSGGGPTLLEARTYRHVGHHEGDQVVGTYREQAELDEWKKRDPIENLRAKLLANKTSPQTLEAIETRVEAEIEAAIEAAEAAPFPDPISANGHVWATPQAAQSTPASGNTRQQSWLDAVRDGIAEEMRANPNIIYLGEGIGERGGSFAHTKGLWAEFGGERVIDTPICELGFTGAGVGAAATGYPAIADLMFSDFVFEAATQIIQQAGKLRYLTRGKVGVPLIIRSGMGAIKNAGAHHSGCYYPVWSHCPGLLVAVPSTPADAKALWKTALRGHDPVLIFEHKQLFASKGEVPEAEYSLPFGQAAIAREGRDITLVACGLMVHRCLEAAKKLEAENISCEVIDLRTIVPLDVETIVASVSKTGRVLVVDEAFAFCGLGGEIAAIIGEEAFDELDAPVARLHTEPVAQPFSPTLEDAIIVTTEKIIAAARGVIEGRAPSQKRAPLLSGKEMGRRGDEEKTSIAAVSVASEKIENEISDLRDESAPENEAPENGLPIVPPNQDLTITEGMVASWLKEIGDSVEKGETICEIETAKAIVAVEAPAAGTLFSINARAGETISMKAILGYIEKR